MTGNAARKSGPLSGLRIVEMAGLGPVPLAGLILSEMGADVVRVERINPAAPFLDQKPQFNLDLHGRRVLAVDLKSAQGKGVVLRMAEKADVLIEGFRPGVMERLGLGPEACSQLNGRLVYARMTGFGQEGPLANSAGHDLTYLAYTGILAAIGPGGGKPVPPLNLVADYGGGTMFVIAGILAALLERSVSGKGQIVDAAMLDGSSMLAAPTYGFLASGIWTAERASNLLDSGAPFYDTYETSDGLHIAVACLEPQFFAEFVSLSGLPEAFIPRQYDRKSWSEMREAIEKRIKEKTRDQWDGIFAASDACVAPVLNFAEAPHHPHNKARHLHVKSGDFLRPTPAPRFSRTPSMLGKPPDAAALDPHQVLSDFGFTAGEIDDLSAAGIIKGQPRRMT